MQHRGGVCSSLGVRVVQVSALMDAEGERVYTSSHSMHETGRLKIEHVFVPQNIDIRPIGQSQSGAGASAADRPGVAQVAEQGGQVSRSFGWTLPLAGAVTGRTISLTFLAIGLFLIVMVLLRLPYPSAETAVDASGVSASGLAPLSAMPAGHRDEAERTTEDDLIDAITSRAVSKLRGVSTAPPTQSE